MTQFGQNPNQPPVYYGYAQADPYAARGAGASLRMCKTATIVQAVLALLMLICGCCAGFYGVAFSMDLQGLDGEQMQQVETLKQQLGEHGVNVLRLGISCPGRS